MVLTGLVLATTIMNILIAFLDIEGKILVGIVTSKQGKSLQGKTAERVIEKQCNPVLLYTWSFFPKTFLLLSFCSYLPCSVHMGSLCRLQLACSRVKVNKLEVTKFCVARNGPGIKDLEPMTNGFEHTSQAVPKSCGVRIGLTEFQTARIVIRRRGRPVLRGSDNVDAT